MGLEGMVIDYRGRNCWMASCWMGAGHALGANALLVSVRAGPRYSLVALGIILVVALDLVAILAISAPFRGAFQVDIAPVTELVNELRAGQYLDWVRIR